MRNITYWLSLLLIFVIPWEDIIFVAGLGTISRMVGILVAVFWLETVLVTGEFRKPRAFHIAVALFMLFNVLSFFWTVDANLTINRLKTYLQLFFLVFILWDLYRTPAALQAGLQAYVLGAYVSIGSLIINRMAGVEAGYQRYTAAGFNPNDAGMILALGLPVAWYLAIFANRSHKTRPLMWINLVYVPVAMAAILLTAGRGTLIAASPAMLFVLCTVKRCPPFLRIIFVTALVAWCVFALPSLVPESSYDRLGTTFSSIAEGDMGGRGRIWQEGLALYGSHPVLGVGSGAYKTAAVKTNHVAHNVYLSVLVELGLIGFLLFSAILVIIVYNVASQPRPISILWLTVLVVWGIGALVHPAVQRKPTWLFLNFMVVSAAVFVRPEESEVRAADPQRELKTHSTRSRLGTNCRPKPDHRLPPIGTNTALTCNCQEEETHREFHQ